MDHKKLEDAGRAKRLADLAKTGTPESVGLEQTHGGRKKSGGVMEFDYAGNGHKLKIQVDNASNDTLGWTLKGPGGVKSGTDDASLKKALGELA